MDPDVEFFLKMVATLVLSCPVFWVMLKLQERKEKEAERQFQLTLKLRGMSSEIIETKGDKNGSRN